MADNIEPISHLEKTIAGQEEPISHLEKIIALYGGGSGSGGSGTNNYNSLLNKPSINGVDLIGNKTLADLGIDLSKYTTTDKAISKIELVDAIPTGSTGTTTEKCLRLTFADGTTVVDVSVNNLVGSDEKQKAIVCVVDDDGTNRSSDSYTGMTTWLKSQGIPMNFAICHDTIGTSGKYTVTQLQELQANGNDILIHGNPKLTTLADETAVITEIESALQFHTSNGLKPTNIYVYPQGLNSDGTLTATHVKEIVGRYFDYGLNVNIASMSSEITKGLWNEVPLIDKLNIARMEVTSTKGFDANKSKIDACIENKGLLILFTHSFQSQFTSGGYDEFKKIINYLLTKDVEFLTVSKALDKVEKIVKNYDDTQVKADIAKNKSDIADLDTNKQDKTDNALDTTDKTVVGAINEVNGNTLDNITFSADYKNIIINRKNGLNPYTIPIASIIHNAKLIEFNDVDSTNIGDGKTLVYDGTTKKHKYVSSTGTDELVKMDSTTDSKHLSELIDKSTIVNNNGVLKAKKLDGQEVTIAEINHLKGLTMNVMDLVNAFSNGGVKVLNTPVNTHADLSTLDRSTFLDGISYIVYVLADETHSGAKTTYLCDKTSETFFGNADSQRNFVTDPINLANEVTGKLATSNIDVDALWKLLTINDTYKTLTTKNEPFGTHGAKALYDELVASIGKKANNSDLTTHTGDTTVHITANERTKWNNKVDKTSILTTISSNPSDDKLLSEKAIKSELDKKAGTDKISHVSKYVCADSPIINDTMYRLYIGNDNVRFQKFIDFATSNRSIEWDYSLLNKDYGLFTQSIGKGKDLNDIHMNCFFTANIECLNTPDMSKNFFGISLCHTGVNSYSTQICVHANENSNTTKKRTIYVRDCYNGNWGDWRTISSTSVADVPKTKITLNEGFTGTAVNYEVKNGVCYVTFDAFKSEKTGEDLIVSDISLPKPSTGIVTSSIYFDRAEEKIGMVYILSGRDNRLKMHCYRTNKKGWCTFSYPVAEE